MNVRRLTFITAALVVVSPAFAQFTGDGFKNLVVGSPHDLSVNPDLGITGATAVCEFCHAPHKIPNYGGVPAGQAAPMLWNIQVKTVTYPTYGNSPILAALDVRSPSEAGPTKQAAYMSLLCLSCHDGGVAPASFYYTDILGGQSFLSNSTLASKSAQMIPNIGNSAGAGLANDHPVDFTYSAALATAAGGLQTPTEGAAVRIPYVGKNKPLPLFKDQPTDTSGRVECATCHNPHDTTYNGGSYFLRMDNTGSAVCLNCHGN
jgi:predicted CXXCH cytochrome family protein